MQIKILSTLCAVACSAFAGQAIALSSTHATFVGQANTKVVFISGTEGLQPADFFDMVSGTSSPLLTGPIYFKSGPPGIFQAVAGTLVADSGAWLAGAKVIVIYGAAATSADITNAAVSSLDVSASGCPGSSTTLGTAANPYTCGVTSGASNIKVDAGVSDIAPILFHGTYNTSGEPAAPAPKKLDSTPIYGLAVGVPVTKNVGTLVHLNKATISAIMTGNIGTWDQVDSTQSGDIVICRRTPGSATQSVFNLYFGNYPCDVNTAFNVPADRDASDAWNNATKTYTVTPGTGGLVVIENSTAADVRTCLDKAVTGTTYTTKDRNGVNVTVNFGAGGHKAIGVLALDSLSHSTTLGNWQFRSLGGAGKYTAGGAFSGTGKFPTLESYLNGTWDLQGWISFNTPKLIDRPSTTGGGKEAFLKSFLLKAQDPVWRAGSLVEAGIPGGSYTTGQLLESVYLNNNQCALYNRNFGG